MVAELKRSINNQLSGCSLAKISMVAEHHIITVARDGGCSLAKISMVAERQLSLKELAKRCSLAKISMVAEPQNI